MTPLPRRRVLEILFGAITAVISAVVGIPLVAAFFSPVRRPTVRGSDGPGDFGALDDLEVGVPKMVDVVRARQDAWGRSDPAPIGALWLVRREAGRVDAFSAVCPHLGCQVGSFDETARTFACPCHVSAFALDGARLTGPSPRGLDPLPVEVKDGRVIVTWKRFLIGITSRREG